MNNEQIKEILLSIEDTDIDFSVTMSGKESKRVNGLYKPDTHEIILHNLNFKSENQLIYTAIHEYTHHLLTVKKEAMLPGLVCKNAKVHTNEFWAKFHELLGIAEQKGIYSIGIEENSELAKLTDEIKQDFLAENGKLMVEFGKRLLKAFDLCKESNIRYEDYIDRVLQLPRDTARAVSKIGANSAAIDSSIGYDNMKLVALSPIEKRAEIQAQIKSGKSPESVREFMKRKDSEINQKEKLESEKHRLEKTIERLTERLELIDESLSQL